MALYSLIELMCR